MYFHRQKSDLNRNMMTPEVLINCWYNTNGIWNFCDGYSMGAGIFIEKGRLIPTFPIKYDGKSLPMH